MATSVSRRQAREWAIQMLTAAELNPPADLAAFMAAFWEQLASLDESEGACTHVPTRYRTFTEDRVTGVRENLATLDKILTPILDNWDLYRLGTIERNVLRLGIWEMTHTEVPKPVIINEAIDIANWFSSPKTRHLVNGVLDRYAKTLA